MSATAAPHARRAVAGSAPAPRRDRAPVRAGAAPQRDVLARTPDSPSFLLRPTAPPWPTRRSGSSRLTAIPFNLLLDFAPFVAGAAAWMGSRDGRRHTTDLVTITARPRWLGQLLGWAATTTWALVLYLGCVAVLYGVTASQATWGGPPWWPVAVGAAGLTACSALGFALGSFLPEPFHRAAGRHRRAPCAHRGLSPRGHASNAGVTLISPDEPKDPASLPVSFLPTCPTSSSRRSCSLSALPWRRLVRSDCAAPQGAGGYESSPRRSSSPAWRRPGRHSVWQAPPTSSLRASSSPPCTTPPATGRSPTLPFRVGGHPDPAASRLSCVPAEYHGGPSAGSARGGRSARRAGQRRQVAFSGQPGPTLSGSPPVLKFTIGQVMAGPSPFAGAGEAGTRLAFIDTFVSGASSLRDPQVFAGPPTVTGSPAQKAVEAALLERAGVPLVSSGNLPTGSVHRTGARHACLRRGAAFRGAARRRPPRLACDAPGRLAGRQVTVAQLP